MLKPIVASNVLLAATLVLLQAGPSQAADKVSSLGVTAEIVSACMAGAPDVSGATVFGTLDFGTQVTLATAHMVTGGQNTGALRVNCAATVPYRVVMGGGNSGNVQARVLTGPGGQVGYNLYVDAAHQVVWDDITGVTGSGNGQDQWLPVYGRTHPQSTPAVGVYTDAVQVTVSW